MVLQDKKKKITRNSTWITRVLKKFVALNYVKKIIKIISVVINIIIPEI